MVVGTAAIVLAMYNLIVIRWCTRHENRSVQSRASRLMEIAGSRRSELKSFKYKKNSDLFGGGSGGDGGGRRIEYECVVCLSVFEEGEEVKQLPKCKHVFHAPCIDMWLYSHLDCPLCRTPVVDAPRQPSSAEHSREGMMLTATSTTAASSR